MAAISEIVFKGVRVKRLDDEGNSVQVYSVPVTLQLEYDPKVMHVIALMMVIILICCRACWQE